MLVIQHNEISSLFRDEEEPCIATVDACNTVAPKAVLLNHSFLHLKTVEITWHLRGASIIPIIKLLLEHAHVLEKMVLRLRTHGADPEMFVLAEEKMLSMP